MFFVKQNYRGDCLRPGGLSRKNPDYGLPEETRRPRLIPEDIPMNRENKRKQYQKGYYRTHACNDMFTCKVCGQAPSSRAGAGSEHRNHCPNCLSSQHVDDEQATAPRVAAGVMEPWACGCAKGGEWAIIHRCRRCGKLDSNRVAADDNPMKLMSIALKPLTQPPFPIDRIEELTDLMGGEGSLGAYGKRIAQGSVMPNSIGKTGRAFERARFLTKGSTQTHRHMCSWNISQRQACYPSQTWIILGNPFQEGGIYGYNS